MMHSPIKVRTKLVGDRRTSRLEIAGLQPLHHPGAIPSVPQPSLSKREIYDSRSRLDSQQEDDV